MHNNIILASRRHETCEVPLLQQLHDPTLVVCCYLLQNEYEENVPTTNIYRIEQQIYRISNNKK